MKQDDFDAAVRRYTEELLRYNSKRAAAEPPPAAEEKADEKAETPPAEEIPAPMETPVPTEKKPISAETPVPAEEKTAPAETPVHAEEKPVSVESPAQPAIAVHDKELPTDEQTYSDSISEDEPAPAEAENKPLSPEETAQEEEQPAPAEEAADILPDDDSGFDEIAPNEFVELPEEKKLEERYRGRGVLKVTAVTADGTSPLENAVIKISYEAGGNDELYAVAQTGISGQIEPIALPAPVSDQYAKEVLFAPYTITAELGGYTSMSITNVPIFDGQITEQTFNLAPLPFGTESGNMDIVSSEPEF